MEALAPKDLARIVIERYLQGEKLRFLSKSLGISTKTAYKFINQLEATRKQKFSAQKQNFLSSCQSGIPVAVAARCAGISESTATRTIREHRRNNVIIITKGRPKNVDVSPVLDDFKELSNLRFPYPTQLTSEETQKEIDDLLKCKVFVDNNFFVRPQTNLGLRLCAPFFPHRFATKVGKRSALEAWQNTKILRRAINFQLAHGDPITPQRVLRALALICRTPSIFRPGVAKYIYKTYCPAEGVVWDPCAGFGGRLLGAFSENIQYIGTDVDKRTVEGNLALAAKIGFQKAYLFCQPAEEFQPGQHLDLVFTSPPYFDREKYSNESTQSYKRFPTIKQWLEGFLQPVIKTAYKSLKSGGYLILNIADLKERNKTIPLVDYTKQLANMEGFVVEKILKMPLRKVKKSREEPILVFRKTRTVFCL